jgi:hypothetical protein
VEDLKSLSEEDVWTPRRLICPAFLSRSKLSTHIASFARQGFTQDEMTGLVACG